MMVLTYMEMEPGASEGRVSDAQWRYEERLLRKTGIFRNSFHPATIAPADAKTLDCDRCHTEGCSELD